MGNSYRIAAYFSYYNSQLSVGFIVIQLTNLQLMSQKLDQILEQTTNPIVFSTGDQSQYLSSVGAQLEQILQTLIRQQNQIQKKYTKQQQKLVKQIEEKDKLILSLTKINNGLLKENARIKKKLSAQFQYFVKRIAETEQNAVNDQRKLQQTIDICKSIIMQQGYNMIEKISQKKTKTITQLKNKQILTGQLSKIKLKDCKNEFEIKLDLPKNLQQLKNLNGTSQNLVRQSLKKYKLQNVQLKINKDQNPQIPKLRHVKSYKSVLKKGPNTDQRNQRNQRILNIIT